jgi:hypothetical protein
MLDTLPTHYESRSKGRVAIADMNPVHLENTLAALLRKGERGPIITAMEKRLNELAETKLDAEAPAAIGHNNPPEPTPPAAPAALPVPAPTSDADPFEAIRVHIEDLYLEAKNWADGQEIETESQAAEVDRLIDEVKDAIDVAKGLQEAELKPLAMQEKAIRERFYPLIADTTKLKGSAIRAKTALLAVKTKWGDKLRAQQAAQAAALRTEALAKAREAVEATKAAPDNLEVAESAEDLIRAAQGNLRQAKAVESAAPKGFRTVWVTTIADQKVAVLTMMRRHPQAFLDLAQSLAERDVREGHKVIEGFTIEPTKVAA